MDLLAETELGDPVMLSVESDEDEGPYFELRVTDKNDNEIVTVVITNPDVVNLLMRGVEEEGAGFLRMVEGGA
jgi:hypothetical protein